MHSVPPTGHSAAPSDAAERLLLPLRGSVRPEGADSPQVALLGLAPTGRFLLGGRRLETGLRAWWSLRAECALALRPRWWLHSRNLLLLLGQLGSGLEMKEAAQWCRARGGRAAGVRRHGGGRGPAARPVRTQVGAARTGGFPDPALWNGRAAGHPHPTALLALGEQGSPARGPEQMAKGVGTPHGGVLGTGFAAYQPVTHVPPGPGLLERSPSV